MICTRSLAKCSKYPASCRAGRLISGNVMQTLHQIDGATAETELRSLFTGGCGKMEQWPLRVAFGGPYLRVRGLKAQ